MTVLPTAVMTTPRQRAIVDLRAVVFCPGPMGIYEQSVALQDRGWLSVMATDFYCDLEKLPYALLPRGRLKNFLGKRYHPRLDVSRTRIHPLPSAVTRLRSRFARTNEARHDVVWWHNAEFDRWVSANIERFGNLAFGYESSSQLTFRRARKAGIPCVLYQPIGCAEFARPLLEEEKRRFPKLAESIRYTWFPPREIERRREERELADTILCASTFTKSTLVGAGVPPEKIHVEPYGVDQEVFAPRNDKFERFSVIWASSYTQTKGIAYLLEAMARRPVEGMELVLAGYAYGADAVALYEDRIRVRRIGRVSRQELGIAMGRCHAHVFPTLLDGFGRNIIEAMAAGLPVITTPNGGGPDLIEDGVSGFIVPIRDTDAIVDRLKWIHDHPVEAQEMGVRARRRVLPLTRADYRRRFADRIATAWAQQSSRA